jgi:protein TonB
MRRPLLLLAVLLAAQGSAAPAAAPGPAPAPASPAPPPPPTDWPFNLFTADDYPPRAMRGEEEGRVGHHLEIGPGGRVTNCTIRRSSGSAALDEGTCRIVRIRARFTPARDSEGNAVPDTRDGEVIWRLPDE